MALTESGVAPYAPARAIDLVIEQYRERGIPTPVTTASLNRMGIEQSLVQRTLASLRLLDLIDDAGEPSPTLRKIRTTPAAELQSVLAEWLREAYKPIFTYVEPTAEVERISDQFRHYNPPGQRNRMVTLFLGLCAKAGLIDHVPPLPRDRQKASSTPQTEKRAREGGAKSSGHDEREKGRADRKDQSSDGLSSARQRYVDLLLAKAAEQSDPPADLLDRIERALGIVNAERNTP